MVSTPPSALFDAVGIGGGEIQSFNPGITGLTQSRLGSVINYASAAAILAHARMAAAEALAQGLYTSGSAPGAEPAALTIDTAKAAVLVVEMQHDMGSRGV